MDLKARRPSRASSRAATTEGHDGWDDYAPFYDWENARTLGRRDVPFWQRLVTARGGRVLELGCGTGRVTLPLARTGAATVVGIDRSAAMLARGRARIRRARVPHVSLVRGDIRAMPFDPGAFDTVIAPYGVLQSLLSDRDLGRTLRAVAGLLPRGGVFGLELVADLPEWREYSRRVTLTGKRGRNGTPITLRESVRQDPWRGLTLFDQEFVEGRGAAARRHQFTLSFRTVSVPAMARRLERAGFSVTALLGDYRGGPWDPRAEVWIVLAERA
ncbi:MAG: class I SAM-dependent methyltransferase [Vicinamibacterales bacterium]